MSKRLRKTPEARRKEIVAAALHIAQRDGFQALDRTKIAEYAGCSVSLIQRYFATVKQLRRKVVRAALQSNKLVIVGQAIAAGEPSTNNLDPDIRRKALESLI